MPAVSLSNVAVSLSGKSILEGINLEVPAGTWLGLLGPNGAGKTTLIRAMSGLIPSTGSIELNGKPIQAWSDRERARQVTLVAQSVPMYFDFSVLDLVLLGRAPHKNWLAPYHDADRDIALKALAQVDLSGFEERSVLTLSGGEVRRALLAQALAQDTPILFLDEPTSHLDVHHQFEFVRHVRSLVDAGRTVVGVFHDLELAARFSDRIAVLADGTVAAHGTPAEVLTPSLIARVFRMQASVDRQDGRLHIDYSAAVRN
ncbi:MAG: ABC transporter ATP-binding protein [Rhodothermales bacterium]|nr:ABC transporter ATP-binding protein [Rhodothermales bacterium]